MRSSRHWRLTTREGLSWEHWGDEHLLYHGPSGATHLLDSTGAELLQALERAPATVANLVEGLARGDEGEDTGEMVEHVEALLSTLHRLGVVEPG